MDRWQLYIHKQSLLEYRDISTKYFHGAKNTRSGDSKGVLGGRERRYLGHHSKAAFFFSSLPGYTEKEMALDKQLLLQLKT